MDTKQNFNKPSIGISKVSITNFMNVEHGEVTFPLSQPNDENSSASIVGLYGQNGSGKSAFVRSLGMLKTFCGEGRDVGALKGARLVRTGCSFADFSYDFSLIYPNGDLFLCTYSFSIMSGNDSDELTEIITENLKVKGVNNGKKINSHIVMDSSWKSYAKIQNQLKEQNNAAGSVIFNPYCISKLEEAYQKLKNESDATVVRDLSDYIKNRLYVIDSLRIVDLGLGQIVLGIDGEIITLEYDETSDVDNLHSFGCSIETIKEGIERLSTVFQVVVPGVKIHLGNEVSDRFLYSEREGISIPLTQESYGVRKLFCLIQHLVNVYNLESYTLVVDEFDEGVFEFLLGQILGIIKKDGHGQLIFTSHNLRPLEVLGKENIYFTTANPSNRYIRMISIKPHNNLRDTYFRAIQLGGQKEELYNDTEDGEIEAAFILAGGDYNAK